jgi:hypothetical protein
MMGLKRKQKLNPKQVQVLFVAALEQASFFVFNKMMLVVRFTTSLVRLTSGARGASASAGQKFIANLDKRKRIQSSGDGGRSRIMFGAIKANEGMIEADILEVIKKVDAYTTKAIMSNQK